MSSKRHNHTLIWIAIAILYLTRGEPMLADVLLDLIVTQIGSAPTP